MHDSQKNVSTIARGKKKKHASVRGAPRRCTSYREKGLHCSLCIMTIKAGSMSYEKQDPLQSSLLKKNVYVLFEAHAARSSLLSKNRTMSVHARTQCWILDGAHTSLT